MITLILKKLGKCVDKLKEQQLIYRIWKINFPQYKLNWIGTISSSSQRFLTSKSSEMEKFKVLKYQKLALTKLRIYPTEHQNADYFLSTSCTSYCVLLILVTISVSGLAFMYKNLSDLSVVLRSSILIFATSQSIGMFHCYAINMSNIQGVHFKLQEIIDRIAKGMILVYFTFCCHSLPFHTVDISFFLFGWQRWWASCIQHISSMRN